MLLPTPLPPPSLAQSGPPAPNPAAVFEAAHQAFQSAQTRAGAQQAGFVIGGQTIQLCFAGRAWLPRFTAALAPRAAPPVTRPDLTVCIWDNASTGAAMPPPPWSASDY